MLKFSWEEVAKINEDDIDIDNADFYCDLFADADIDEWDDNNHIKHVFHLTQVLLNLKWEQWKFAESSLADRSGEINNLKDQIKELEHENKDLQKAVSASGLDRGSIGETRRLEIAVAKLESELESLRIAKDTFFKEKEELISEKGELERKIELISRENKELVERCDYLHMQLQDRPSLFGKTSEEANYRKEISSLRAKIRVQKAEIDALEDEKQSLWSDVKRLESNLKQASLEIDRATDDYLKMKEALTEADRSHAEKTAECNMLRAKLASISETSGRPEDANDFIMNVVEQKIEEWKEILVDKDMEIVKTNEQLKHTLQELRELRADSDKTSVRALVQTIKDRDNQIHSLKNQLTDATSEVEKSTTLLKDLAKQVDESESDINIRKSERIAILKRQLQEKDSLNVELEKRLKHAEEAVQLHANEVTVLEKQLKRYEAGEYGLPEAISELKATRLQLNSKERQVEEICRLASQAESSLNEVNLENEHLRTKLGIPLNETIDLNGYRRQKRAKDEEDRAVNIILQKEIEKLEDERLELKRKLRTVARQLGQQYGLSDSHVDGILLGNLVQSDEEILSAQSTKLVSASLPDRKQRSPPTTEELLDLPEIWKARFKVLDSELAQAITQIEEEHRKQDKLEAHLKQITEANILLENGLREVQKQIKHPCIQSKDQVDMDREKKLSISESSVKLGEKSEAHKDLNMTNETPVVDCPSLDKLLAALDSRKIADDVDAGRFLKSRVDHLEGANQELRLNLRDIRLNSATNQVKLNQAYDRIKQLESQLRSIEVLGNDILQPDQTSPYSQITLPKDINPDSAKTILTLEEHLMTAMKDINDRNMQLDYFDKEMDDARRRYAVCRHRQGLLYRDFYNEPKLADQSRQLLLLRVNEASILRRYSATQEREAALSRENTSLKSDLIQLESAVSARLNYYARYKESAAFQIQKLQKTLDHCVTEDELNSLRNDYETLAIKYRELLERDSDGVNSQITLQLTLANLDTLKKQHDELKEQLVIEKEKKYLLEKSACQFQLMITNNVNKTSKLENDISDANIAKRLALMEIKELNERERANHAQSMLRTVQDASKQLEIRNKELEDKFTRITASLMELQQTEQKLRQELAKAVPILVHRDLEKRNTELEQTNLKLLHEIEQLKEVALISMNQHQNLEDQLNSQTIEIQNLREQVVELESKDDSRANLARLHRLVTRMQISESTALRRLASTQVKVNRLETDLLKTEKRLTQRENELTYLYNKSRERERKLRETITSLRQRYAGCIPLGQQEKVSTRLTSALRERVSSNLALDEALNAKIKAESMIEGYEESKTLTSEIHNLLTEHNNQHPKEVINKSLEKKLLEWQERLSDLRVSESAQRRQVERLKEQVHHLESLVQNQETQLNELELENSRLVKELDQRETQWEQREAELEGAIEKNAISENIISENMSELKSIPNLLANEDIEPVLDQMSHDANLYEPQSSSKHLEQTVQRTDDQVIAKLRSENTAFRKRLTQLLQLISLQDCKLQSIVNHSFAAQNPENQSTLASLRANMELLQRRLNGKDESLARVNELLRQAYEANEQSNERHRQEISILQNKLHNKMEETMLQLAQKVESVGRQETSNIHMIELKKRLSELEEALSEQNQAVFRQSERTKVMQQECDVWQLKYNQLQTQNETEKNNMEDTHRQEIMNLTSQVEQLQTEIDRRNEKITEFNNEIKRWKTEASKSPSVMQRQLTERLRIDLLEKDKQIRALSKALGELRHDLVAQAEQAVLATNSIQPIYATPPVKEVEERQIASETFISQDSAKPLEYANQLHSDRTKDEAKIQQDTILKLKEANKRLELECKDLNQQLERIKIPEP
ncbi:unnamed protein product [Heterobilharzia americana]|nr:unnamed protein product [Heterobilharzia americana]